MRQRTENLFECKPCVYTQRTRGSASNPLRLHGRPQKEDLAHFEEQVVYVEETAALGLDALDAGVGGFDSRGVDVVADAVDDLVGLGADAASKLLQQLDARCHGHPHPVRKL